MHSYTTKIDEDSGLTREEGRRKIAHVEWMLYGHQGSVSNAAVEFNASVWIIALKHFREFSTMFTGWGWDPGTWALIEDIYVQRKEPSDHS